MARAQLRSGTSQRADLREEANRKRRRAERQALAAVRAGAEPDERHAVFPSRARETGNPWNHD
jgi:hypothetical protein